MYLKVLLAITVELVVRNTGFSVVLVQLLVMLNIERVVLIDDREIFHPGEAVCELKFYLGFTLLRKIQFYYVG